MFRFAGVLGRMEPYEVLGETARTARAIGYGATMLVGPTGRGAGRRVPVATAERLLPDHVLRRARFPVGGRVHEHRDGSVANGHADRVRRAQAVDERGGVRAVAVRQPPTAVDRLGFGDGVLGRSGGGHVLAAAAGAQRPHGRDAVVAAAVAVGGHRGVHVRQFVGRAGVPVGASRRTVARPVPGPGGRGARVVRVPAHVRRAFGVSVFPSG